MIMLADKNYCMSSFLTLRYIEDKTKCFASNIVYNHPILEQSEEKILVYTSEDIDKEIGSQIDNLKKENKRIGILLSGGMDSAILASYLSGCDAYTFRFEESNLQDEELKRAEYFAKYYKLDLHYVDISWESINANLSKVMKCKGGPVHSIEPQIFQAAMQAKEDKIDIIIIGDASDYIFYGMDKILSRDWRYEEFRERCTYVEPKEVLINPIDMNYLFERYRKGEDGIDFLRFFDTIITEESYGSYQNAFKAAKMNFLDPYEILKMACDVDLYRIRNGESKYLIRELFRKKYPIKEPEKNPMPRMVDLYFENWNGPTREEFKKNIEMSKYTGNQKWLLYCLERFLNENEL